MPKVNERKYDYYPKRDIIIRRRGRPGATAKLQEPLIPGGTYVYEEGELKLVKAPDKKPKVLKVRVGFFRTAGGSKAQVFLVQPQSKAYPAIGAVLIGDEWEPRQWNLEGVTRKPYGVEWDLVEDWKD